MDEHIEEYIEEYIEVRYPTIGVMEKRRIAELARSSLVNAFTLDDYLAFMAIFKRVVERLESGSVLEYGKMRSSIDEHEL